MTYDPIALYHDYTKEGWHRFDLIKALVEAYGVTSALYPGSYVHITPSLMMPRVVYVDLDRKAKRFFSKKAAVAEFIEANKIYEGEASFDFYAADYGSDFLEDGETFDLVISQYAGFISHACKKHLKKGGILLANNSHGDAGVAYHDPDYQFIAVAKKFQEKWRLSEKDLEQYFIPKKPIEVSKAYLMTLSRGLGYKKTAEAYVFRKVV